MKINFNSLIFRTLSTLLLSSITFIIFIAMATQYTFSQGYKKLIVEKISIIENNIVPSISLNLSFGFSEAIDEIGEKTIANNDVLLLKIESNTLEKDIIFSSNDITIKEYKSIGEFISTAVLIDPTTNNNIGKITLVYSKKSYEKHMQEFYTWFIFGIVIFGLSILMISLFLYNSLKHLSLLSSALKSFNPSDPKQLLLKIDSKDEIASIASSANNMVDNLIKFLNTTKELNKKLSYNQLHLKEAQKIAHVGSWEYNISDKSLSISDEIYRILGIKKSMKITWEDFAEFIVPKDREYISSVIKNAIKNGSNFDVKCSIIVKSGNIIDLHTKGKVRKKENGITRITAVSMDITQDTKNKRTIEKLAYYDSLTGLANRLLLKDRMHKAIQSAKREKSSLAVIFLDLDHFKLINDTLGHSVGDELLIYIANVLKTHIRESDTLSRVGGDYK